MMIIIIITSASTKMINEFCTLNLLKNDLGIIDII